mmetsp:Transcript_43569/g.78369  ORF Transcript_43569/g.78369 Transcript_43569/m.78369 type:complete len:209 (-) Transcript_43569:888-1514(-)
MAPAGASQDGAGARGHRRPALRLPARGHSGTVSLSRLRPAHHACRVVHHDRQGHVPPDPGPRAERDLHRQGDGQRDLPRRVEWHAGRHPPVPLRRLEQHQGRATLVGAPAVLRPVRKYDRVQPGRPAPHCRAAARHLFARAAAPHRVCPTPPGHRQQEAIHCRQGPASIPPAGHPAAGADRNGRYFGPQANQYPPRHVRCRALAVHAD